MPLTEIELNGFRCFIHYKLSFKQGVNLLIGDNGSGKTSVIRGITLALNAFFKGFSDENTSCAGIASDDFNHTVSNESKSLTRPAEIVFSTESIVSRRKRPQYTKMPRNITWQTRTYIIVWPMKTVTIEGRRCHCLHSLLLTIFIQEWLASMVRLSRIIISHRLLVTTSA